MDAAGTISSILHYKDREVVTISPETPVYEAIKLMSEENIGALIVVKNGKPCGIISERDYTRRIILEGRNSKETKVEDIMTKELVFAEPSHTISKCMHLVTEYHIRHIPVMEEGKLVGLVSIGDLVRWIISSQNATIDQLTEYITGQHSG